MRTLVRSSLLVLLAAGPARAQEEAAPAEPEPPREVVVVTASRGEEPLSETVPPVTYLPADDLRRSPALMLDDALRGIPGFSLFRRSSSLVAHPTTQGVSFRGIGPSGAGRSLVLFDDVPLNDPYGGWVYWSRLPAPALRAVEMAWGAASPIYGSSALSGAIQLLPLDTGEETLEARVQGGSHGTADADLAATGRSGDWGWLVSGRAFHTGGFFVVGEKDRGAVDVPAASEHGALYGRLTHGGFFAGVNLFGESRSNGTPLQVNDTRIGMLDGGFSRGGWDARVHVQTQRFRSDFSRVLPDRSAEILTVEQDIHALGAGGSLTWKRDNRLHAGGDFRRASAEGNRQALAGLFAQGRVRPSPRLDLLLGLRVDARFDEGTRTLPSPRAGLLFRAAPGVVLRGLAYGGFRAPTLNELHRPFQVGNVTTLANPDLDDETLWGAEAGAEWRPPGRLSGRLELYWNRLTDPVANVTLSSSGGTILRQRQNLGHATIRGAQADLAVRAGRRIRIQGAYLYSDARVDETGLRLPQVPLHQGTLGVALSGRVNVLILGRFTGEQFEDDRNTLPLAGFGVVDLSAQGAVTPRSEIFLAVENLLDRKYPVGRTPVTTLGTPRLIHGGWRFRAGGG